VAACAGAILVELGGALLLEPIEGALRLGGEAHETLHRAEATRGLRDGLDGEGDGSGCWNGAHAWLALKSRAR
ncbi:MAG: hypothetical protein ACK56F_04235, partial [bacterium]